MIFLGSKAISPNSMQHVFWMSNFPILFFLLHSPIPGCTGLRPDNLAHNLEFDSTIESALSTGSWNSFEMGSGIPQVSARADSEFPRNVDVGRFDLR